MPTTFSTSPYFSKKPSTEPSKSKRSSSIVSAGPKTWKKHKPGLGPNTLTRAHSNQIEKDEEDEELPDVTSLFSKFVHTNVLPRSSYTDCSAGRTDMISCSSRVETGPQCSVNSQAPLEPKSDHLNVNQKLPPSDPQLLRQPISLEPERPARPSEPSKTRLARFLHFSRSKPSEHCASRDPRPLDTCPKSSTEKRSTSLQTELYRKLSSRPPQTLVRWEQPENHWTPGFERNQINQSFGQVDEGRPTSQDFSGDLKLFSDQFGHSNTLRPKLDVAINKSSSPFTQLELQWLNFKRQSPGVILLMEVGYKIRLFGSDAVLASKVLSIGYFCNSKFESAIFPKTNLHLHLKRLVMAGHKVGLVTQSETRATKNYTNNKRAVFDRRLSRVYSLATWTEFDVDSDVQLDSSSDDRLLFQTWIMSFYEEKPKKRGGDNLKDTVEMSMVALCPQSGQVIWDCWIDGRMRNHLETLLLYFTPHEIVLPLNGLSAPSENLINWFISQGSSHVKPRLETIDENFDLKKSFAFITSHCQSSQRTSDSTSPNSACAGNEACVTSASGELSQHTQHIIELPDRVLMPLAVLISHVKSYNLESIFRQSTSFRSFSSQSHMNLNANTLSNYGRETGSLMWILDHTKTSMGKRLLKQWIGRPLVDIDALKQRSLAVHEVVVKKSHPLLLKMKHLLGGRLTDLERSLVRIHYGKCTEVELLKFLDTLIDISSRFIEHFPVTSTEFQSDVLTKAFGSLSSMQDKLILLRSELDGPAIRRGDIHNMFMNGEEQYPEINEMKDCLACVEGELEAHLVKCRDILKNPKLEYLTIGSDELLFEVRTQNRANVPTNWIKISSTKAVYRYRTPDAQAMMGERERFRDLLDRIVRQHFHAFLRSLEEDYEGFRNIINQISTLDCLFSLAIASEKNNYCKPTLVDHPVVNVKGARHPIVEQITDNPFVDNDVHISRDVLSTMILTGNNMGGKSVTSKMLACIVIMAQIGCYIPAKHATIGIFDACFTRMGMSDELGRGRSSFMVELTETASILKAASPRSLVIFDELGCGTSTHDGTAIASAVLHHLVTQIGCFTLFITHYPPLNEIALTHPGTAKSFYMNYIETEKSYGTPGITFLYKLTPGVAHKSHGVNVARLAGFETSILQTAQAKSQGLKEEERRRDLYVKRQRTARLLRALMGKTLDGPRDVVRQARAVMQQVLLVQRLSSGANSNN